MWNYNAIHQQERVQQNRELQERYTENSIAQRLSQQEKAEEFSISRYLNQKETNLNAAEGRRLSAKQDAAWGDKHWELVKERKDQMQESIAARQSARTATAPLPSVDVRQTLQQTQSIAPQAENSKPITFKPIAQPTQTNGGAFILETETHSRAGTSETAGGKPAKEGQSASGMQTASTEKLDMSPYFNIHADAKNEPRRSRNRFAPDLEEESLCGAVNARMSAIVEPSVEYKNVSAQETLLPRLQEVIQRLSAMGQSWARVVIPVDAQTNVVVRFSASSGRVKLHLSTPTQGLSDLIAAGWRALVGQVGQHGITLDDPTFDHNN